MTGTTENNINDLLELLNVSENILRYNSSIESEIKKHSGTVLYSYNNIIIASEISDDFYSELKNNPFIDYIQDLPLKKYGDVDGNLIDQLDVSKIFMGTYIDSSIYLISTGVTDGVVDGVSGDSRPPINTNVLTDSGTTFSLSGVTPVITNQTFTLSASTNSTFDYIITANGSLPMTFDIIKPINYVGELKIKNSNTITGKSSNPGIYNIAIKASNIHGSTTKFLKITVLEPVKISNTNFLVYSRIGSKFSYTIESSGTTPKIYSLTGQPSGITLSSNIISGVFTSCGTYTMNIGVSGLTSSDSKNLVVEAGVPPVITSLGNVSGEQYSGFTYIITSNPSTGVTYTISGMIPVGLKFSVNQITGIPFYVGISNAKIKATNPFGETTRELNITIYQIGS